MIRPVQKSMIESLNRLALLGIVFADELPLWLALVAGAYSAVKAFITVPAGIDCTRRHKLFCWQLSERRLFMLIAVLFFVGAIVTGPTWDVILLSITFASGGLGFWLSRCRRST